MNLEESNGKLEKLPTELIQEVLARLPDVQSLVAAVLTGSHIYNAFLGAENKITKKVLLRQIPTELLHDALATEASSRQDTWTREQADNFLSKYFSRDQQPFHHSLQWSLSQALPLAQLYSLIGLFTASLTSPILEQKASRPLSETERSRIGCNFYRFQIYCNLFRNKDELPIRADHDQREKYFAHFAPWENEQLACIQDYLTRIITPAFEEVAISDPSWIDFFAIMDNGLDEGALQHHLSFGLAHIREFMEAKTPESQRALLASSRKRSTREFLSAALKESNWLGGVTLAEFEDEDEEEYIPRPWYPDPDIGPEDAWRWALQSQYTDYFVFSPSQIPLRQWAYVMWDRARLDEWKVFDQPWEGIDVRLYEQQEASRRLQESGGMHMRARDLGFTFL